MSDEIIFNDQMIDESTKPIHQGEIVEGTVLEVSPERIVMNVHHKYDGIVTKEEYSNDPNIDLESAVAPGDVLEVKVLRIQDNEVQLSFKRISEEKANRRVEEAFENKEIINVKVEKVTTGGLITSFEGAKIFVPASLVSDIFEKDLSKYMDQDIDIIVTEYNPRKRRVIGNRRKLVQAAKAERAKELLASLQVNDIVEGVVKSITSFGAFVDLGGVDGLLHISEMSWGRVDQPKSVVSIGDKLRVFIKNIEDGKIALSRKFPDENPWKLAKDKYIPGTIVTGKVARMADFGAFIELEPGIDALLHVSQISKKRINKPADVLKIGQIIDTRVVQFKEEEKKISLSRKDFDDDLVPDEEPAVAAEEAEETDEKAIEAVEETVEEVTEAAEETAEIIAEEAAEEVAEETAEAVEETAEEVAEAVEEAAEEVVEETAEAVEETAEEVAEAVEEAAEEVAEEAAEAVEETAEEVAEAVEEAAEKVAEEAAEAVEDATEEIAEAVEEAVEKNEEATE
jgi:ribosomal protein S1